LGEVNAALSVGQEIGDGVIKTRSKIVACVRGGGVDWKGGREGKRGRRRREKEKEMREKTGYIGGDWFRINQHTYTHTHTMHNNSRKKREDSIPSHTNT
jgi:hypothetical protein